MQKWVRALGLGGVFLVGCGQSAPEESLGHEAERLTAPTQVSSFALLSSGHVTLGDRMAFTGGHLGVFPGTGDSVTEGSQAVVALGKSTLGQRVVLKDHAQAGDLFTNSIGVGSGATYSSQSPYAAPPAQPPIVAFTAGTAPLTVNSPMTVAAGNFGQVTVNSTLTLSGGTYQLQNLTLGNSAVVQASAASIVRVAGKVSGATSNFVHIGPTGAQPAANFRLIVAGTTDTNGGVTLGTDAKVTAIVVSRASFSAADRFAGKGAFAAKNVTIGNDSSITFQTGFECNGDTACDDGNPCTTDACMDAKCIHTALANGTACPDDGNVCTSDACSAGVCAHPALANGTGCTSDNNECTIDECTSGACVHPAVADGTACTDDGSECTIDQCSAGACTHPALADGTPCTSDGNACTSDACETGACSHTAISGCSTLSRTPTPLSPPPPSINGCYARMRTGWQSIPCATPDDVLHKISRPDLPEQISVNAFTDSGGNEHPPLVYGQFQASIPAVASSQDVFLANAFSGCPTSTTDPRPDLAACITEFKTTNHWSFQGNTNDFVGNNMANDAVQFVLQANGSSNAICIWNIDVDTQDYGQSNGKSQCVMPNPPQRAGGFQPFDWGNVAGYVDTATGKLKIQAAMTWVAADQPYEYAVVADDAYGLQGSWFTFDGALLGEGCCSQLQFTDATVVSRLAASSCPGDTQADSDISGCTGPDLTGHVSLVNGTGTLETNNLMPLIAPAVSYPNAKLAVANWTSSTSGACVGPDHAFIRDYDDDLGAIPSNLNGQAFWESPDIFVVPTGTTVDVNATTTQSLLTPGGTFDFYVRVNNDFGCADVTGAQALIYLADPSALSAQWVPVTGGNYLGDADAPDGDTVPAGGKALIGPFTYAVPSSDLGDGHKCLIAAVRATGEPEVANAFDAPNSNQVGQRNVQFDACSYPLTNAETIDRTLSLTLSITPPELLSGATINVDFDDADRSWYSVWSTQPDAGSDFMLSHSGNTTTVELLVASVTLADVTIHAGETRTAHGSLDLVTGAPATTLDIQGTLKDGMGNTLFTNGGECVQSGPGPIG